MLVSFLQLCPIQVLFRAGASGALDGTMVRRGDVSFMVVLVDSMVQGWWWACSRTLRSCLFAVVEVSIELFCSRGYPALELELAARGTGSDNLRSRPHLPPLALEPTNPLLSPLSSHLERCWRGRLAIARPTAMVRAPRAARGRAAKLLSSEEARNERINSLRAPRAGRMRAVPIASPGRSRLLGWTYFD